MSELSILQALNQSILDLTTKLEQHVDHYDHVLGLAATPDGELHRADHLTMTPFQSDAGDDQFGSWLQIIGSDDTPHVAGKTLFELNRILIVDVEAQADKAVHLIQIGFGASGSAALSSSDVTEIIITPERAGRQDIKTFDSKQQPSGTKVWLRHWIDGVNTGTMDFFIVIDEE